MTGACPRCRAQLTGPFCAACGLQLNTPPPPMVSPYAPPGYVPPGYAPPGYAPQAHAPQGYIQPGHAPAPQWPPPQPGMMHPQPGMQPGVQYMGPGGVPYMMMTVPNQAPSKGWATAGGVMNIVTSSIYLLIALIMFAAASDEHGRDKSSLMTGVMFFIVLGIAGIIFGVYSVRGRWGGALGGGIVHAVLTLVCFGFIGVVQELKEERRYDYYDSSQDKGAEAVAGFLVIFALLSLLTAIFCFIGISGAKARARYDAHMRATEHF